MIYEEAGSSDGARRWARSTFDEVRGMARLWNQPVDLFKHLTRLMTERPGLALATAVAIGMVIGRRYSRARA